MPVLPYHFLKTHSFSALVYIISAVLALTMLYAAWDIHFWPTDAEDYYLDSAKALAQARFISDIHQTIDAERVRLAHGKEIFFLCISFFQRLLNDLTTLRPIVLVCVISLWVSAVLFYQLLKSFFGPARALVGWFLFTFSAWPYMYILMAKHQLTGLMFFLGAVFFLERIRGSAFRQGLFSLLTGLWLGFSFFSSTVSALYGPYFMTAFVYLIYNSSKTRSVTHLFKRASLSAILITVGFIAVLIYINLPDVWHNIRSYWEYVHISGRYNHFFYNQPFLQQWLETASVANVRGGWLWIIRYFQTIMPVLFPVYIFTMIYLVVKAVKKGSYRYRLTIAGAVFLSFSSCLMAEMVKAAQYGANYFPALIGMIFLIVFCLADLSRSGLFFVSLTTKQWKWLKVFGGIILAVHLTLNAWMFWGDIYPCRMSKNYLSAKIRKLNPQRMNTYLFYPHRDAFVPYLDADLLTRLSWTPIQTIAQAREGLILIPPISGDSIYIAATSPYIHFDKDLFLNTLIETKHLEDYSVASFRTLANSRFWLHEEEILTYRNLILGHDFKDNHQLGRVWLLDAERLSRSLLQHTPLSEDLNLMREDLRNIGTQRRFLIYKGTLTRLQTPLNLLQINVSLGKNGSPRDSLRAYVYKLDDRQPVWIPAGENFYSLPLLAVEIRSDKEMTSTAFRFDPPLSLEPGPHYVAIYRTGQADDQDYYTIKRRHVSLGTSR